MLLSALPDGCLSRQYRTVIILESHYGGSVSAPNDSEFWLIALYRSEDDILSYVSIIIGSVIQIRLLLGAVVEVLGDLSLTTRSYISPLQLVEAGLTRTDDVEGS